MADPVTAVEVCPKWKAMQYLSLTKHRVCDGSEMSPECLGFAWSSFCLPVLVVLEAHGPCTLRWVQVGTWMSSEIFFKCISNLSVLVLYFPAFSAIKSCSFFVIWNVLGDNI